MIMALALKQILILSLRQGLIVTAESHQLLIRKECMSYRSTLWANQRFKSTTATHPATLESDKERTTAEQETRKTPKKLLSSILVKEEPLDPPIKYSTSKASKWKAMDTHTSGNDKLPPYQPLVVSLSVIVFLIYFCFIREENDIDEEMGKTLWERVPGLERQQLDVVLEYNRQTGQSTTEIENRIKELDEARTNITTK